MMKSKHNDLRRFGLIKLRERDGGGRKRDFRSEECQNAVRPIKGPFLSLELPSVFSKEKGGNGLEEDILARYYSAAFAFGQIDISLPLSPPSHFNYVAVICPPSIFSGASPLHPYPSVRPSSSSFAVIWERQIDSLLLSRWRNRSSQGSRVRFFG